MGKKILKHLSGTTALVKDVLKRINISKDQPAEIPSKDSYIQNKLANAMHKSPMHLYVAEIIEHTKDVKTFVLKADKEFGKTALSYPQAGNYISIHLEIGEAVLNRPYSLSSSPKEAMEGKYTITVKRVSGGLASEYILDNWTVGTKVLTSAPLGVFTYEPIRDAKTVIGLAGGSGITPFYSFAKAILEGSEDFNLILLYGNRTSSDILFKEEFESIQAKTDKFKLVNVIEDGTGDESGFITADIIKKYAPSDNYSIFICGPQGMYNFLDKEIKKLNIKEKFVRHELFGEYRNPFNDAEYPQEAKGQKFKLVVHIREEVKTIEIDANDTLLNAMEHQGISVPNDCRSGMCGWCHSRLISGKVYVPKTVDGRRAADLKFGYIHPCCTFAISDLELEIPPMH